MGEEGWGLSEDGTYFPQIGKVGKVKATIFFAFSQQKERGDYSPP